MEKNNRMDKKCSSSLKYSMRSWNSLSILTLVGDGGCTHYLDLFVLESMMRTRSSSRRMDPTLNFFEFPVKIVSWIHFPVFQICVKWSAHFTSRTFFDMCVKAFTVFFSFYFTVVSAHIGYCIYNYAATYGHANLQSLQTGCELSQFGHDFIFNFEGSHDKHRGFIWEYIPSLSCSSVFSRLHNCVANTSVGLCMGGEQAIGMWQVSGSSFPKKPKRFIPAQAGWRLLKISYQLRTRREKIYWTRNRRND